MASRSSSGKVRSAAMVMSIRAWSGACWSDVFQCCGVNDVVGCSWMYTDCQATTKQQRSRCKDCMEVASCLLVLVTSGSQGVWDGSCKVSHVYYLTDNWRSLVFSLAGLSRLRAMAHATIEARSYSLPWLAVIPRLKAVFCLLATSACLPASFQPG